MSPMHAGVPANMGGCVLIAKMPEAVVPDESVWIIHPAASRSEMKYGAIRGRHRGFGDDYLIQSELDSEFSWPCSVVFWIGAAILHPRRLQRR
jgi:hypothetical protein